MGKFYMCPACDSISNVEKWNKATVSEYGNFITGIEEDDKNNCSYCCPECNEEVQGCEIMEVK